jgi:hypothetical protein
VWRTNDACLMMLIVMMIDQLAVHVMNTNLNKHYFFDESSARKALITT